jgi:S1-C subfamily serine protease
MRSTFLACGWVLLGLPTAHPQDGSLPDSVVTGVKHATVYVQVQGADWKGSGSGFVVRADRDSVLVATNYHVLIGPAAERKSRPAPAEVDRLVKAVSITGVFDSGLKSERSAKAEPVAADAEHDLAILRIAGLKDPPQPLDYDASAKLTETMNVFSFGFPFGRALATGKGSPTVTVGKASVSSIRLDDSGDVAVVQIDGSLNPGNSGGPIVDGKGRLVGVAAATVRESTGIGLAVPAEELRRAMRGRLTAVHTTVASGAEGKLKVRAEVGLIDPTGTIRGVTLHHVAVGPKEPKPARGEPLAKVPNVKTVAMKVDGRIAVAEVTVDTAEGEFFIQAVPDGPSKAASAVASVVLRPAAAAESTWQTVTSKEGQFTVEMPAKPDINRTRARTGRGGTVRVTTIGYQSEAGLYLVYRIDLPTAVVRAAEQAELDAARDDLAQEWNGKVLTEKKVTAGSRAGRDFTVRGRPADATGDLTIRVRMYLDGKTVYALLVGSAPNRELPADAGRFLGSLAIGNENAKAVGGLEPDPPGKDLTGWGLAVDPDGDCKFTADGKKSMKVEVPGTWHDLNPHVNKLNSPRVIRTVEGDFSVTVRVGGEFRPTGKPQNPKSVPSNGGGIVVWKDSDNFIRLERFAISRGNRVTPLVIFLEREGGYQGAEHNEGYPGGDCYLRMERKGSRITGSWSTDGTRWKQLKPIDTVWPPQLKVGLTVANSNSEPLSVTFDEFALTGQAPTTPR